MDLPTIWKVDSERRSPGAIDANTQNQKKKIYERYQAVVVLIS